MGESRAPKPPPTSVSTQLGKLRGVKIVAKGPQSRYSCRFGSQNDLILGSLVVPPSQGPPSPADTLLVVLGQHWPLKWRFLFHPRSGDRGSPGPLPPLLSTGRDLGRGSVDVRKGSCVQEGSALTRRHLLRRSADMRIVIHNMLRCFGLNRRERYSTYKVLNLGKSSHFAPPTSRGALAAKAAALHAAISNCTARSHFGERATVPLMSAYLTWGLHFLYQ